MSKRARAKLSAVDWACFALLIIGAINWGVIGVADINPLSEFLGLIFQPNFREVVERVLYGLVGVAGIYFLYPLYRLARTDTQTGESS